MEKQLTKQEILNELHSIQTYMEERDAFYGYGQMTDLIKKLERECNGNIDNSKHENCTIFDISGSLHIDFGVYLTGHDKETIEQMYNDWQRYR